MSLFERGKPEKEPDLVTAVFGVALETYTTGVPCAFSAHAATERTD